jgi:tRNA(fMet)-specific endonuclease VapC
MAIKRLVLDTNAYSRLLLGDQAVKEALNQAEKTFVPLFVIAELLFGFKNGSREEENRKTLNQFLSEETVELFLPTLETAEIFSALMADLKKKGAPLPTHDVWIAAIAIETGSVVVTYDRHFLEIAQARVWSNVG